MSFPTLVRHADIHEYGDVTSNGRVVTARACYALVTVRARGGGVCCFRTVTTGHKHVARVINEVQKNVTCHYNTASDTLTSIRIGSGLCGKRKTQHKARLRFRRQRQHIPSTERRRLHRTLTADDAVITTTCQSLHSCNISLSILSTCSTKSCRI